MKNMLKKTVVAISILSLLYGCGEAETADKYITQAKTQLAQNDINTSIISLKNAIQIDNKNAEARYLLGKIYLESGNILNAIKELEKADSLVFDDNLVLPLLANAYYLNDDFQAITALKSDGVQDQAKNELLTFQALSSVQLDNIPKARNLIGRLSNASGETGHELLVSSYIAFSQQELEVAKTKAEEALSKLPGQPQALLLLGHIGMASQDFALASENYRKYMQGIPNQHSVELMLSNALMKKGDLDEAEKHADNILRLLPNQPFANYIKAMARAAAQDYEAANKHAETAIANKFNQRDIKLVAGVSAFYLKKFELALYHLKPLQQYLPADHFARKLVIVSQMELGLIVDAADTLDDLSINTEDNPSFYSALSYKLLQAGATEEARELIAKYGDSQSNDPEKLLQEGFLQMMVGDQAALKSLEKAVELDPQLVKAELALAYLAVKSGDINKAQLIAEKWKQNLPDKADGLNLESAIAVHRNDLDLAKRLLMKGLEVEPNNSYGLVQLAIINHSQKNEEDAKQFIAKALEQTPNNIKVLRVYDSIFNDSQSLENIAKKYKAEQQELLGIVYAEALVKRQKIDEATNVLNGIEPSLTTPKLYFTLKVYVAKEKNNKTLLKSTLDTWRKLNPYHVEHYIYLAEYYSVDRKPDSALKAVEEGLIHHPDNLPLSLVKAHLLIDLKDVRAAKQFYSSMKGKLSGLPAQNAIEGRLALLENDYELAQDRLLAFYTTMPSPKNALFVTSALVNGDKKKEAILFIEDHINTRGFNQQLASLLGSLLLEQGQNADALNVFESMVKQQPNNVIAMNNAAWLLMEQGKLEEAERLAADAVKLAPNVSNIADTYSQILLKAGKAREALTFSRKAYEISKGKDVDIALNYVEALLKSARKNEARKILTPLAVNTPEQEEKKTTLLNELKSS
ncbi:XrtA/PEP-CTERM system TPR-repeat protein PrsT [Thalassotalea euphylliae]|uniref:XrtA/PEP-CTERM system TPR-repeat protein PrsT n=1 Tax=Thalassotalea euphylliae TaxID=1655234 RepID=UPI00363C158A